MQQALVDLIDELIQECKDERFRLKAKRGRLEVIRAIALKESSSKAPVAAPSASVSSNNEPPAKKQKIDKEGIKAPKEKVEESSSTEKKPKKEKKVKEKKDPNKPKRPQSAYNLFFQDYSKKYKTEHPDVSQKDIMALVGPIWKELDAKGRAQYEARAAVLKDAQLVAVASYESNKASNSSAAAPTPLKKESKSVIATPASSSSASSDGDEGTSDSD